MNMEFRVKFVNGDFEIIVPVWMGEDSKRERIITKAQRALENVVINPDSWTFCETDQ